MPPYPTTLSDHRARLWVAVLVCLSAVHTTPVTARQSATATVQGVVRDGSKAILAGAAVVITSVRTGEMRATHSGFDGSFLIVALAPGSYRLAITLEHFAPTVQALELTLSQIVDASVTLTVASRAQTVEIAASAHPLVDPAQTEVGRTVTTDELDGLPMSVGQFRDFTGLATLAPGVAPDVATNGGGIATAGQVGSNNNFIIDGLSGTPENLPLDAIQEFRIASNQFGAAYGQASGAVVDVLTRSGSNTPAGRLSWFQQDGAWNATSPLAVKLGADDPGFAQTDVSGFWGGPLAPNRAFLFGAVRENVRRTEFLDASPVATLFRPGALLTTPVDWNLPQALVRADVRLTPTNAVMVRYNYNRVTGNDAARELSSANERRRSLDSWAQNLALVDTQILGPAVVNELRLQGTQSHFAWSVDDFCPDCATLNYRDILLGKPANAPSDSNQTLAEVADTMTWVTAGRGGRHDLKAGVDLSDSQAANLPVNTVGTYKFFNDLPFDPTNAATYPNLFTKTINGTAHREGDVVVSLFVSDEWRPAGGVTVNLGARWDRTRFPGPSPIQNDVAPRLAIAVDPWTTGRTLVRAGVGRYYDARDLQTALDADTGTQEFVQNPGYQGDLVTFDPLGFNPNRGGRPVQEQFSLFEFAPTATPYTDQATVGVTEQLGRAVGVTVDLVRALGHQLPIEMDLNYPDPLTGRSPDPTVKQIIVTETIAQSWYTGLQIGLRTRPMRGGSYSLAYTWSSSTNDTDGGRAFPSDGPNLLADRGPTLDDARHRLTASGTIRLPAQWTVQGIVNAWSPLPYNVTTGSDDNHDGVVNDRPVGVGRNSARGSAFFQADVRVSRLFHPGPHRLEVLIEAFNVTNRANWMAYNGVLTAPNNAFGQPQSAGPPRQIQLGVRWSF
jgi:hypothetical protein